ncbi:GNAT family N-acetyltransferase [Clavibacter nebraskensis]|uniref:GNAT family N-acetyltransferase n=1 Tax=Clavibacter nebraskensis TaxID=31963 RepID=UPI00200F454C|nr:GNAT family N-acetyltransferase [Clavibacter nebraskensis]UQB17878.1 GNAT family N-acetyltransferase [Clavibacter nebraskensis]
MTVTIRTAAQRDESELTRQTQLIAGTIFDWTAALTDPDDHVLTFVATINDRVVGHIAVGRSGGFSSTDERPHDFGWLKIHTLAVVPDQRQHGVGRRLLQHAMAALPRDVIGLYGSVIPTNTPDAIAWYRARGFLITTMAELDNPRMGRGVRLLTTPDQLYFYSDLPTLRHWTGKRATERSEVDRVQKQVDRELRLRQRIGGVTRAIGYRVFADHAINTSAATCPHMPLAVMRGHLHGWDPELRTVCAGCEFEYLGTLKPYDAEDRCDGCGQTTRDVELGTVARDAILVASGLCSSCRARTTFTDAP